MHYTEIVVKSILIFRKLCYYSISNNTMNTSWEYVAMICEHCFCHNNIAVDVDNIHDCKLICFILAPTKSQNKKQRRTTSKMDQIHDHWIKLRNNILAVHNGLADLILSITESQKYLLKLI